jgi:hypothetical protein
MCRARMQRVGLIDAFHWAYTPFIATVVTSVMSVLRRCGVPVPDIKQQGPAATNDVAAAAAPPIGSQDRGKTCGHGGRPGQASAAAGAKAAPHGCAAADDSSAWAGSQMTRGPSACRAMPAAAPAAYPGPSAACASHSALSKVAPYAL